MRPRTYLVLLALTALCAGAAIAWLARHDENDPAALDRRYVLELKTAREIAAGRSVILGGKLNEWMLRWDIARLIPPSPDAAIFGSSHSLGITSSQIGATNGMNFSISGSSFSDHLVTASILESRGVRPKLWVIFVDAWLFDRGADFGANRMRRDDLQRIEALLRQRVQPPLEPTLVPAVNAVPLWQRFSLQPVLDDLNGRLEELLLSAHPAPDRLVDANVLGADGALQASFGRRPPTTEEVRELALRQFTGNSDRHRYGSYPQFDEAMWQYFEQWVLFCREQGEVWLVLSPYHPAIYPDIAAQPHNRLKAIEARVREFASTRKVPLIGSYDPALAGVPADEFIDGDHLRESGLTHLLTPVRERPGAAK